MPSRHAFVVQGGAIGGYGLSGGSGAGGKSGGAAGGEGALGVVAHVTFLPAPPGLFGPHGPGTPPMQAMEAQWSLLSPTWYTLPEGHLHVPPQPPTAGSSSTISPLLWAFKEVRRTLGATGMPCMSASEHSTSAAGLRIDERPLLGRPRAPHKNSLATFQIWTLEHSVFLKGVVTEPPYPACDEAARTAHRLSLPPNTTAPTKTSTAAEQPL